MVQPLCLFTDIGIGIEADSVRKKLCLLAPTITMTLVREGSFCTILGPNFGNASVLWFAEMH